MHACHPCGSPIIAAQNLQLVHPPFLHRHTYVRTLQAKEGAIEETSQAWQALSAADRARRKHAAQEMTTKLRNPNFFVSRTRLSLRSLPKTVDEAALKVLLIDAVKQHASRAVPHIVQARASDVIRLTVTFHDGMEHSVAVLVQLLGPPFSCSKPKCCRL